MMPMVYVAFQCILFMLLVNVLFCVMCNFLLMLFVSLVLISSVMFALPQIRCIFLFVLSNVISYE